MCPGPPKRRLIWSGARRSIVFCSLVPGGHRCGVGVAALPPASKQTGARPGARGWTGAAATAGFGPPERRAGRPGGGGLQWPAPCRLSNAALFLRHRAGRVPGPPPWVGRRGRCYLPGVLWSVPRGRSRLGSPEEGTVSSGRSGEESADGGTRRDTDPLTTGESSHGYGAIQSRGRAVFGDCPATGNYQTSPISFVMSEFAERSMCGRVLYKVCLEKSDLFHCYSAIFCLLCQYSLLTSIPMRVFRVLNATNDMLP
ncbi:hypothetical protein FJT64_018637 [Amphibalanus amphitrite]|uniref:Uncharacterized protein n=1 Tax=Amphibalanus amphitrite TaxID=1232801 RepID=A0A6A4X2H9_AMPAM|nr:hypothetical protein FJT64_018637 [Amphibalanus amphitrite]